MLGKGLVRVRGRSDDGQVNVRWTSGESQSELDFGGCETCLTLKNPDPHFHRNTWRMSDLQCYTETWRKAHCPYFLCFSNTWRMSYLQSVQNQCILHQSLRRLKLLKNLENVIFARKWQIWHSPGFTRRQLNKCHKSYNNNNTALACLILTYMQRSGYLGVKPLMGPEPE